MQTAGESREDAPQARTIGWSIAALATLLLLSATLVRAADGDTVGMSLLSRQFVGTPHAIVLDDPVAYVGLDSGLHIFDITTLGSPLALGHVYLPSPAYDLTLVGTLVYVACGESGLQIVDVSDPSTPWVLGSLPTQGTRGVDVLGNTAYLAEASDATGVYGLRTVDVGVPSAPVELAFLALGNGALDVIVDGALAYVGLGSALSSPAHGLVVVDVSSPASPTFVGAVETGKAVNELAVVGSVAYLATGFHLAGAFVTVDLSVPATPTILSTVPLGDAATGVSVVSGVAHVAARSLGMLTYDVSLPDSPTLLDSLSTTRESCVVAARGDVAFMGERSSIGRAGFTTVSTPPAPLPLEELISFPYAEATDADSRDGLTYLLRRDSLSIFDSTDPALMVPVASWAPPGADLSALGLGDSLAAVSQGPAVRLVDILDPGAPTERGEAVLVSGVAVEPVIQDSVLYVVNGMGFETFDISDPSAPAPLGTYATSEWTSSIAIADGTAYLTTGSTLQIVDVSTPSFPSLRGSLALFDQAYGVDVRGGLVVVGGLTNYAYTIDVSTPASPSLLGVVPGGAGFDVRIFNNSAFIASGEDGVLVVDVSVPSAPLVAGYFDTSGSTDRLGQDGNNLFLATGAAQHWAVFCDVCPDACAVFASVDPPSLDLCEGASVLLDGTGTSATACSGGMLSYQWYESGFPIPGATFAAYILPPELAPGTHRFHLEATCLSDPTCSGTTVAAVTVTADTFPTIRWNSLKGAKLPASQTLSWVIESGTGESNLHSTLDKTQLPDLYLDSGAIVATSPDTAASDSAVPPLGSSIFYRVFGRGSCTGASIAP